MTRNLLLIGGPAHEFDAIAESLDRVFRDVGIASTIVDHPDKMIAELAANTGVERYDLLTVHALHWGMDSDRYAHLRETSAYNLSSGDAGAIRDFVTIGGGLLALHTAVICFDAEPIWHGLCGAAWNWERSSHPPVGESEITVTDHGRVHPITTGLHDFTIVDEVYGFLDEDPELVPLLVGSHGGRVHPVLWARSVGAGRVVTDVLGHDTASLEHPSHAAMLQRAALWVSAGTADTVGTPPAAGRLEDDRTD